MDVIPVYVRRPSRLEVLREFPAPRAVPCKQIEDELRDEFGPGNLCPECSTAILLEPTQLQAGTYVYYVFRAVSGNMHTRNAAAAGSNDGPSSTFQASLESWCFRNMVRLDWARRGEAEKPTGKTMRRLITPFLSLLMAAAAGGMLHGVAHMSCWGAAAFGVVSFVVLRLAAWQSLLKLLPCGSLQS